MSMDRNQIIIFVLVLTRVEINKNINKIKMNNTFFNDKSLEMYLKLFT